ncbi:uncharacterized protein L3040_003729 [Drepanopeziza brunnea f. sp. 'multigermtubi']|uniref:uncharacterized protein n=1 Tax=Drepanopeziza brunnea f. sp. 'multigermtubi' TaxID=698441 RepID=UPI0023902875|nr:hypothetical protein L3040_003729 [Drepanopeziza brunnea f. sp. 'multigermtubi']
MAELEERPSKIRKIESPDGSSEPFQGNSSSMDLLDELPNGQAESAVSQAPPTEENPPLSKSQLKKLKKAAHWEAGKEYRRTLRREKHKEKQARKAKEREEIKEKVAKGEMERPVMVRKPGPRRPIQVPISFVLDCDFNDLMMEKEIISLGAQLTRCYSDNKCNPYRAHLSVSSWGGTLQKRFETVLTNNHKSWKGIRFFEEGFETAAEELHRVMRGPGGGKLVGALGPKSTEVQKNDTSAPLPNSGPDAIDPAAQLAVEVTELSSQSNGVTQTPEQPLAEENLEIKRKGSQDTADTGMETASICPKSEPSIVYLTSDSPNTLRVLSPYTTYIIGGIVDKNRHKGLCYKRACERGIPTARLPIGEFMTMQSRTVLTVNHVMEIMLKWLETGDWGEAFLKVIPKRKEAKLRVKNGGGSTAEQEQQGEESDDYEQSEVGGSLDVVNGKSDDEN